MTTGTMILIIVLACVIVALAGWIVYDRRRSRRLHGRFGPEYERVVSETGDRRKAEAILESRTERVQHLAIRPLEPERRTRYMESWRTVQARFVDDPAGAVKDADHLVGEVMADRGYPVGDFEQRAADISVDHPEVVQNYRAAHDIALRNERGQASTEDLRRALVHYRALFEDLLDIKTMGAR